MMRPAEEIWIQTHKHSSQTGISLAPPLEVSPLFTLLVIYLFSISLPFLGFSSAFNFYFHGVHCFPICLLPLLMPHYLELLKD
jgi:hypothetical protein